jgi:CRP-like cAMP-binding protein
VSDKDLKKLSGSLREKTYSEGETVVEEGAGGIGFFFILEGKADVRIRGEVRATMKAGDHFGELGLLDDTYGRSASVVASGGPLRCAALTSWQFKPFVREHPDMAWELLVMMAKRLNATEHHYAAAS